jgi:hypothetical protein
MKTLKDIASEIARREGKKKPARIGEVREVLGIVSDMVFEDPRIVSTLFSNGQRRAKIK